MMSNSKTQGSQSFLEDRIVPINFDKIVYENKLTRTHVGSAANDMSGQHQTFGTIVVPCINVSDPDAGQQMCNACEKIGVFHAIGHGLPVSLLNEVEAEIRRLFALPMETKMQAVVRPGEFVGFGLPKLSKFYANEIWSEGFTIRGSPEEHLTKLWPDVAQRDKFCNVMNEYQRELEKLSKKIIAQMITSLGLKEEDVPWMNTIDKNSQALTPNALRFNSYPICPNPGNTIGMGAHTDTSIITLLYQNNVDGLQIQMENGEWMNVQPVDGALEVNLGDLMHIATNGKLKSVLHRVMANGSRHRISVSYFYGPPRDVEVAPAEKLVKEGKLPLYPTVTWDEYLNLKHTHGPNALETIRREEKCRTEENL